MAARLIRDAASAALAVTAADGAPYAAFTAPAISEDGAPLILASDLSAHGRALGAALAEGGSASLLYADTVNPAEPLKTARLTVQGAVVSAEPGDREAFLAARPESELYIDFGDMRIYRLRLTSAHLVAGFGRAVALDPSQIELSTGANVT